MYIYVEGHKRSYQKTSWRKTDGNSAACVSSIEDEIIRLEIRENQVRRSWQTAYGSIEIHFSFLAAICKGRLSSWKILEIKGKSS